MRALERLRQHAHRRHLVEFALELHPILAPRPSDNLVRLVEPFARMGHRDPEALELLRLIAAAEPELEPAAGEDVDLRPFLRDPDRVLEGGDDHGGTDPRAPGLAGESA